MPFLAIPDTLQSHLIQLKKEQELLKKKKLEEEKLSEEANNKLKFDKFIAYVNELLVKLNEAKHGDEIKISMDLTIDELNKITKFHEYNVLTAELLNETIKLVTSQSYGISSDHKNYLKLVLDSSCSEQIISIYYSR